MAKKIDQIKEIYRRLNEPIGIDEEKDKEQLNSFLNFIEKLTNFGWFALSIFGLVSLYFFITHEIL